MVQTRSAARKSTKTETKDTMIQGNLIRRWALVNAGLVSAALIYILYRVLTRNADGTNVNVSEDISKAMAEAQQQFPEDPIPDQTVVEDIISELQSTALVATGKATDYVNIGKPTDASIYIQPPSSVQIQEDPDVVNRILNRPADRPPAVDPWPNVVEVPFTSAHQQILAAGGYSDIHAYTRPNNSVLFPSSVNTSAGIDHNFCWAQELTSATNQSLAANTSTEYNPLNISHRIKEPSGNLHLRRSDQNKVDIKRPKLQDELEFSITTEPPEPTFPEKDPAMVPRRNFMTEIPDSLNDEYLPLDISHRIQDPSRNLHLRRNDQNKVDIKRPKLQDELEFSITTEPPEPTFPEKDPAMVPRRNFMTEIPDSLNDEYLPLDISHRIQDPSRNLHLRRNDQNKVDIKRPKLQDELEFSITTEPPEPTFPEKDPAMVPRRNFMTEIPDELNDEYLPLDISHRIQDPGRNLHLRRNDQNKVDIKRPKLQDEFVSRSHSRFWKKKENEKKNRRRKGRKKREDDQFSITTEPPEPTFPEKDPNRWPAMVPRRNFMTEIPDSLNDEYLPLDISHRIQDPSRNLHLRRNDQNKVDIKRPKLQDELEFSITTEPPEPTFPEKDPAMVPRRNFMTEIPDSLNDEYLPLDISHRIQDPSRNLHLRRNDQNKVDIKRPKLQDELEFSITTEPPEPTFPEKDPAMVPRRNFMTEIPDSLNDEYLPLDISHRIQDPSRNLHLRRNDQNKVDIKRPKLQDELEFSITTEPPEPTFPEKDPAMVPRRNFMTEIPDELNDEYLPLDISHRIQDPSRNLHLRRSDQTNVGIRYPETKIEKLLRLTRQNKKIALNLEEYKRFNTSPFGKINYMDIGEHRTNDDAYAYDNVSKPAYDNVSKPAYDNVSKPAVIAADQPLFLPYLEPGAISRRETMPDWVIRLDKSLRPEVSNVDLRKGNESSDFTFEPDSYLDLTSNSALQSSYMQGLKRELEDN